ncbi:MAG: hypothetical protein GF330_11085 [Candidatus Eisenbacteria bacterium]|nr:hypothetical protein [Candidatus Eisenbacteria bacterium]
MFMRTVCVAILCAALVSLSGCESADTGSAPQAAAGDQYLGRGQFAEALDAYAAAIKAEPENQELQQKHAMLRQVIDLRAALQEETEDRRWSVFARALRAFYYAHGLHDEALELDRQAHQRLHSPETALLLAETLLELDQPAEAAQVLSDEGEERLAPGAKLLLGIAKARQGDRTSARDLLAAAGTPPATPPATWLYRAACLNALLDRRDEALQNLAQLFETTPPTRIEATKARVQSCPDFASLADQAEFASVLETPSKIELSSCTGGSSCGSCALATSGCPSSGAASGASGK